MKEHWLLDRTITFLNHGSFGATPRVVMEKQSELRERMEREPVRFLARELEPLLDEARSRIAPFLGADPQGLAFVANATAGVNAVLRSLDLDKHDELLVTDHEYNACRNALEHVASAAGAKVVVAALPFPVRNDDEIVEAVLSRVTDRTRLLLIDHITSPTAIILPVERLVRELQQRGIDTLVDGAHAPGMVPLDLRRIDAAWYTGNFHKWVSAPKGSAFLYTRPNRRYGVHPAVISHGANSPRTDRSRYLLEFDWTGTFDPTAWLCVPDAIRFMDSLVAGGWPEVMRRNHLLALRGRDIVAAALEVDPPAPDAMLGSMAALPLPDGPPDLLQQELFERFSIEVPINAWPQPPKQLLRVSAQLYNEERDYETLAAALRQSAASRSSARVGFDR
ncbi:MAG TPA: aminotransferase class V-fold PLP-dependent enzyme [Thermoanaerobaculia bacterium]|nr:aminotransferase class V-fold PLP-dependent enzyme [Thermoanaerobaculia bacterium]